MKSIILNNLSHSWRLSFILFDNLPGSHLLFIVFFFFKDAAPPEIYTLSLHDALPILDRPRPRSLRAVRRRSAHQEVERDDRVDLRSEEHTSELQSRVDLVCRLLL